MNVPAGQSNPASSPEAWARCENPGTKGKSSLHGLTPAPLFVDSKGISFLIAGHRQNGK